MKNYSAKQTKLLLNKPEEMSVTEHCDVLAERGGFDGRSSKALQQAYYRKLSQIKGTRGKFGAKRGRPKLKKREDSVRMARLDNEAAKRNGKKNGSWSFAVAGAEITVHTPHVTVNGVDLVFH